MNTINRTELGIPDLELVKERTTEGMIRKENLSDLLHKPRDVAGLSAGFSARLPVHDASHDKRHFETTYGAYFGRPGKSGAPKIVDTFMMTSSFAAGKERVPKQLPRSHVLMVGEILRRNNDPKYDTDAQRVWIGKRDAGVLAAETGGVSTELPATDNALSLPLGDGERARMLLLERPGIYNKRKTDITAKIGKKNITKGK